MSAILSSVGRACASSPVRSMNPSARRYSSIASLVCVDRAGRVACLQQVLDRALGLVRLGEVVGEQPVHLGRRVAVELHERLADPQVELPPARLDERPVGDLLHEPVPEAVLGRGSAPLLDHELEPLELGERRPEPRPREEPLEQREAEGAPDHGGGREQLARVGVEPVEPRLQCLLDGGRDRGLADEHEAAVLPLQRAALAQVSNRLPDEVRVAARALGEQLRELVRQLALRPPLPRARARRASASGSSSSSRNRCR